MQENRYKKLVICICLSSFLLGSNVLAASFVKEGQTMPANAPTNTGNGGDNAPKGYVVDFRPKDMKIKFGGSGSYIFGDYALTGKTLVKLVGNEENANDLYSGVYQYLNENGSGFNKNSSEEKIILPKDVRSEDIVYVGLYWQGNIGKRAENQTMKQINETIKGYQDAAIKFGTNEKVYPIHASYCGGLLSANGDKKDPVCSPVMKPKDPSNPQAGMVLVFTTLGCYKESDKSWVDPDMSQIDNKDKVCKEGYVPKCKLTYKGTTEPSRGEPNFSGSSHPVRNQGIRMFYGCGADITSEFKEATKDKHNFINESERKFTVGSVNTSDGTDNKLIDAYYKGQWNENWRMGRFSGWSVVVVYSKDSAAQNELRKQLKESSKMDDKQIDDYIQSFYRAKSATIYEGYKMLEGSEKGEDKSLKIKFSGFFTPKQGKIQSKIGFFGEGGEINMNAGESMSISNGKDQKDPLKDDCSNVTKWQTLNNGSKVDGKSINIFDGSERVLVPELGEKYEPVTLNTGFDYNFGLDLDEFNISDYVANQQSSLCMRLDAEVIRDASGFKVDQSFIPMVAMSVDIYVPKLCYTDQVYNVGGWLKFFNKDGSRKSGVSNVPEISGTVIAGEELFYKARFENQKQDDSEDASGMIVTIDFDNYNYYDMKKNSCTIDNNVEGSNRDAFGASGIAYKYLINNKVGAYNNPARTEVCTEEIYKDKQLQSVVEAPGGGQTMKFYIGKDAGVIKGGNIAGGVMKIGNKVYAEFNSTVGPDYKYHPLNYKVGYSINPAGSDEAVVFDGIPMEKCPDDKSSNVEVTTLKGLQLVNQNYKDSNEEQDDRLYSQVAEQNFDVKLIFKPDFSHLLKDHCIEWNEDKTKCKKYDESVQEDAKKPNPDFTINPDGTLGEPVLKPFKLDGKLYLSLVRADDARRTKVCVKWKDQAHKECEKYEENAGCIAIRPSDKIPFTIDGKRYVDNYEIPINKDKNINDINKIGIEDAFQNVTFMLSYVPDGVELGKGSDQNLTEEQKKELKGLEDLFGIPMSPVDNSFHICDTDAFSVRPAYFTMNTDNIKRYAKTINPNAAGDITKAIKEFATEKYRVGGDYRDNDDVALGVFYAESAKNNGVPNYNPTIGGDLSSRRFSVLKDSDGTLEEKVVMQETFLEPFISKECKKVSNGVTYFAQERGSSDDTLESGTGKPEYIGMEGDKVTDISSSNAGKAKFDSTKYKVWDLYGSSLWVNFNTKGAKANGDGTFTLKYASQSDNGVNDYLKEQARLEPSKKDKNSALLYNQRLTNDPTKLSLGYYNVGDVKVNVLDNSWLGTDRLVNSKFKTAACVLNSTSNEPNDKGMIGCDVGMKDGNVLVLRYQPDRVQVGIKGVENYDNNKTIEGNTIPYTYYNMPHLEDRNLVLDSRSKYLLHGKDAKFNKAILNTTDNLAKLSFGTRAYISDSVYKNVIATMFDGSVISGTFGDKYYEVPVCGFATDIDTKVLMRFDCSNEAYRDDPRCAENGKFTTRTQNIDYKPFGNFKEFADIKFDISNYQYLDQESCNNPDSRFDSRCFVYTPMSLVNGDSEVAQNSKGSPLPLANAINYYSDGSRNNNVINTPLNENPSDNELMYSPKNSAYRLLAKGFHQGVGKDVNGFFNFDRSQKLPNKPLIIIGKDFIFDGGSKVNPDYKMPGFDKDGDLVNTSGGKLLGAEGGSFSGEPAITTNKYPNSIKEDTKNFEEYIKYIDASATDINDYIKKNKAYAYFVYGDINYHGPSDTVYGDMSGVDVNINSRLYCGMSGSGCKAAKIPYLDKTIFSYLAENDSGWLNNIYDIYNRSNIDKYFVHEYNSDNPKVTIEPSRFTNEMGEKIKVTSKQDGITAKIKVFTNPWSIYTPNDSIMLRSKPSTPFGKTTNPDGKNYYNYFNVSFRKLGDWGGEGTTKNGDVVGNFAGKDKKSNTNSNPRVNSRIDW